MSYGNSGNFYYICGKKFLSTPFINFSLIFVVFGKKVIRKVLWYRAQWLRLFCIKKAPTRLF